ncbi:hypothetical protein BH20CHL7_BH20CHL7_17110 [soil metagenome]|jgi:hypothetical protein
MPGSRYARAVMAIVAVLVILGLVASAVAYPMAL